MLSRKFTKDLHNKMATVTISEKRKWHKIDALKLGQLPHHWTHGGRILIAFAVFSCSSNLSAQERSKQSLPRTTIAPISKTQLNRVLAEGKHALRYTIRAVKLSSIDSITIPTKAIELLNRIVAEGPDARIDNMEQLFSQQSEANTIMQVPRASRVGIGLSEDPATFYSLYVSGRLWSNGIRGRFLGNYHLNSHCENHDAQTIMAGLGLINNGRIYLTTEQAWRLSHVMSYAGGAYGAVFSSGLVAGTLAGKPIAEVAKMVASLLPKQAHYRQVIDDVMRWHQEQPSDYTYCLQKLNAKWAPTAINPITIAKPQINPDAKLNGGIILMALLYGNTATKVTSVADADMPYYIISKAGHAVLANAWVAGLVLGTKQIGTKSLGEPEPWSSNIPSDLIRSYQANLPSKDVSRSSPLILEQIPSYRGMQEGALAIQISPQSCIRVGSKLEVKAVSYPAPKQVQWHWGDHTYSDGNLKNTEGIHTYNQAGLYEINCYALLENGTTLNQITTIRVSGPLSKSENQPCLPRAAIALGQMTKSGSQTGKSATWSAAAKAIWFEANRNTTIPMVASILSPINKLRWVPTASTTDGFQLVVQTDSIKNKEVPLMSDNFGITVGWGTPNGQSERPNQNTYVSQSTIWKLPLTIPKIKQLTPEAMVALGAKTILRSARQSGLAKDQVDIHLAYTNRGLTILLPNNVQDIDLQFDARLDGQVTYDNSDTRLRILGLNGAGPKFLINDREATNAGITISPIAGLQQLLLTIDWNTLRLNLGTAQREEQGGVSGIRQFGFQLCATKTDSPDLFGLFYSLGFPAYDPSELGIIELGE